MQDSKQKGSISIFGVLTILMGITALTLVMELGHKMIEDRNFDNYAQSLAPVAMRTEIALTQVMVDNGEGNKVQVMVNNLLNELGHNSGEEVKVRITFGNIVPLASPQEYTDPSTNIKYTVTTEFVPLAQNASNPKVGLSDGQQPPDFGAVAIELIGDYGFLSYQPKGKAIYGLSDASKNSSDVASCFCDTRYNQCLVQPKVNSVMWEVDTKERQRYCDTGIAPSVSGGFMGAFFGGHAKFDKADMVKLSPQWVGTPYTAGDPETDQTSSAWEMVQADAPLQVANGVNPFPEASWDARLANWIPGNHEMTFKKRVLWSMVTKKVDGSFYVGRSGTCAYPSNGFFFFGVMKQVMGFMTGNTDCLRYSADPALKYDFFKPLQGFMSAINGVTGANEHYYSCRDFSGLQSSRGGFLNIIRRLWSSPLQDWTRSYQDSECVVHKMHLHGWWIFKHWQ